MPEKITANEIKTLRRIWEQIDPETWSEKDFLEILESPKTGGLKLNQAGFILWQETEDEIEIILLAVHPGHQRKGIASTLLEKTLSRQKNVFLEVSEENKPAIALYLKNGFKQVGLRKKYYKNTHDALVLKHDARA